MKNNKGVTLISILVVLIAIIILTSVAIVAGNSLIKESREQIDEQEYETVLNAIRIKKTEVNVSGKLTPAGASYIGIKNPIIDNAGTPIYAGDDWYLLEESHLRELGVEGDKKAYIVNYKDEIVLLVNAEYEEGSLYNKILSYTPRIDVWDFNNLSLFLILWNINFRNITCGKTPEIFAIF